jgi:hypothetical protein
VSYPHTYFPASFFPGRYFPPLEDAEEGVAGIVGGRSYGGSRGKWAIDTEPPQFVAIEEEEAWILAILLAA